MARSNYVYVVMVGPLPIGTFTDEHELWTWMNRLDWPAQCRFFRLCDGRMDEPIIEMDRADIEAAQSAPRN